MKTTYFVSVLGKVFATITPHTIESEGKEPRVGFNARLEVRVPKTDASKGDHKPSAFKKDADSALAWVLFEGEKAGKWKVAELTQDDIQIVEGQRAVRAFGAAGAKKVLPPTIQFKVSAAQEKAEQAAPAAAAPSTGNWRNKGESKKAAGK